MADLQVLMRLRGTEKALEILTKALAYAKEHPQSDVYDLQKNLGIGYGEAVIVLDWLGDTHESEPKLSNHWIRAGRTYVLNNPMPTLTEMTQRLKVGEKRGYLIMQTLMQRGLISVNTDFSFIRTRKMHTFKQLIRQVQKVAKKYGGRCEFGLLERTLYIDPITAFRLAQYAEEHLGLYWKNKHDWIR